MAHALPEVTDDPSPRKDWRKHWFRLTRLIVVIAFCYWGLLGCLQRSMLYPAMYRPAPLPLKLPADARELSVTHDQGQTHAYLFLGEGVSADRPGPAVIFSHGNGELIEDYADGLPGWQRRGVSVLITEYRGVGRSDGSPTKQRIDADHVALYDLLAQQPEVAPTRIIFHGRSMGGGIVASLALQRPPVAMVLESTYSTIADFAKRMLIPLFLIKDRWDVTATLRQYQGPVILQLGPHDEVMPQWMLQKNREASPHALVLTLDASHGEPMPDAFFEQAAQHLREHGVLPRVQPDLQSGPHEVSTETTTTENRT